MKVFRIYTGPDKRCHFEDVNVPYRPEGRIGDEWELPGVKGGRPHLRKGTDFLPHFHVARFKRTWIQLEGTIEVASTTGEAWLMEPGDVLFIEDMEGEGHVFRLKSGRQWGSLIYSWAQ